LFYNIPIKRPKHVLNGEPVIFGCAWTT